MRPGNLLQAFGLLVTGFLLGVIVTGLNAPTLEKRTATTAHALSSNYAEEDSLRALGATDAWDVFADTRHGRRIALGQKGVVRVVVVDDVSALYVMTYKEGEPLWQGRLMDVGNNGTIEVADLSAGHCEAFP